MAMWAKGIEGEGKGVRGRRREIGEMKGRKETKKEKKKKGRGVGRGGEKGGNG